MLRHKAFRAQWVSALTRSVER